jgi:quercetin dioxygenase-like cupin family protein
MVTEYKIERWKELSPPNPAMLRMLLVQQGYDVVQWSDLPDAVYAQHKHDENQSHWIISGTLELTVERVGTFELAPGDRDIMPAGTYHSARVIGDEPVMYLIGIKRK